MEWTDESIARLRGLWQEGLSTAEIGRRMQITKNAVVGKAHRLDLAARPSPIRKPEGGAAAPHAPRRSPGAARAADGRQPRLAPQLARPAASPAESQPVARPRAPVPAASPAPERPAASSVVPARPVATPSGPETILDNVRLLRPALANPSVTRPAPVAPGVAHGIAPGVDGASDDATQRAANPPPRRRGLTCCWPLGEPGTKGFHFCGGEPAQGKPYCAEHAALAYVKLRDRRDSVA